MAKNELRINKEIRVAEARVIDQNGNMIGVIPISKALQLAFEAGLDLVEVSPNANPVVCRIVSYSKLKYEEQKKASLNKKKQKVVETKELKLSLNIGDGDFLVKMKQAIKFLEKGDKVKQEDIIAEVGETGKATGPHIHFEIIKDERVIDPEYVMDF